MTLKSIQPQTNIEWPWTLGLVELSWEILRYRLLKTRILEAYRVAAIEAIFAAAGRQGDAGRSHANGAGAGEASGAMIETPLSRLKRVRTKVDLMTSKSMVLILIP
jgi:hypothetical protein